MKKSVKKSILTLLLSLSLAYLMSSCAAGPLTRGSAAFFRKPPKASCTYQEREASPADLRGEPILVYARADWCPMCGKLDELLEFPQASSIDGREISIIVFDVVDGYTTSKNGISSVSPIIRMGNNPTSKLAETKGWKKVLTCQITSDQFIDWSREKRIPIIAGIDESGTVIGRIVGYHPGIENDLRKLLEKIGEKKPKLTEDTVSSTDS